MFIEFNYQPPYDFKASSDERMCFNTSNINVIREDTSNSDACYLVMNNGTFHVKGSFDDIKNLLLSASEQII